jgi:hypothetical protein
MQCASVVVVVGLAFLSACSSDASPSTPSPARSNATTPSASIVVAGTFVKETRFPCHLSDPFVGGERVTFTGTEEGAVTTIVTGSADWTGLAADPREAPLGRCRQVAPYRVRLPADRAYVVEINGFRFPPVTLSRLRSERFRHTFRLPS